MRRLIDSEIKILVALHQFEDTHNGFSPTIREIMDVIGSNSTSHVGWTIDKLAELGLVETRPDHMFKTKGYRINGAGRQYVWKRVLAHVNPMDKYGVYIPR